MFNINCHYISGQWYTVSHERLHNPWALYPNIKTLRLLIFSTKCPYTWGYSGILLPCTPKIAHTPWALYRNIRISARTFCESAKGCHVCPGRWRGLHRNHRYYVYVRLGSCRWTQGDPTHFDGRPSGLQNESTTLLVFCDIIFSTTCPYIWGQSGVLLVSYSTQDNTPPGLGTEI